MVVTENNYRDPDLLEQSACTTVVTAYNRKDSHLLYQSASSTVVTGKQPRYSPVRLFASTMVVTDINHREPDLFLTKC